MRRATLGVGCVAALAVGGSGARAQLSDPAAGSGIVLQGYTFSSPGNVGIQKVSMFAIPATASVRVGGGFQVGVSGAYASASVTRPGGESATLSGFTDTEIRLTYGSPGDRLRVSAVALAPTGASRFSADEMDVAGVVASDLLPFAISQWGSGGGIGGNFALALPMGTATSAGASAGYVVAREFQPLAATTFGYRPGNQLQARVGADHTFGTSAKGSVQLTYLHFAQDERASSNFYQPGDRLQALTSLAFAAGARGTALVYAGYLHRAQGQYTAVVQVTPAENLAYAGGALRAPVGRGGVVFVPSLDVRVLGSPNGVEQGGAVSAGAGIEVPAGSVLATPTVRARFGRLTVRAEQASAFQGFEVGLAVHTRELGR